jgi:hypothetical protein
MSLMMEIAQATCYLSDGEKQYTVCPYCKVGRTGIPG